MQTGSDPRGSHTFVDYSQITGYAEVIPGELIAPLLPACRRYVGYAWGAGETFPRTMFGHQVNTTLSNRSWLWEGLATELYREERTLAWSGHGASQVACQRKVEMSGFFAR